MLGYTRDELLTMGPRNIVPPDLYPQLNEIVRQAATRDTTLFEIRLLRKDGTIFPAESSAHLVYYDSTRIWLSTIRDITERKRTEEALRVSEQLYTQLFDHANDGIVIVQDGIIRKINSRFAAMSGYTAEEVTDKSISIIVHPGDVQEVLDRHFRRTAGEKGIPSIYTFRIVMKTGKELWVELNTTVIDCQGRPATLNIVRDITDRKRADDALHEANRKLNLLSSITRHDVLNKLTVLWSLIELSGGSAEKGSEFRSFVDREIEVVNQIQRIISFTKEYQVIGVNSPEWQDVGTVISGAAAGLDFAGVMLDAGFPGYEIYADLLLPKVFYNLFDNSLRYGGEQLSRIRVSGSRDNGDLRIIVEDNGTGIDPEMKEHLFERGFGKNTGLGLFLSKEILAITGIDITENGESGKGARFEIRVPNGNFRLQETGGDTV
jgi:PAS domain S-box-containing protein